MKQLITPTAWIPATGGWCLQYVRQAYGLEARYDSATEAWEKSTTKHRDRNFPEGMWTPVWYGIDIEPLGHVVLRAPDGTVYSTSDYSGWPRIHKDLADLEAFYAYYGMNLQYRGWTEDVAGFPVMEPTITAQGTITTPKGLFVTLTPAQEQLVVERNKKYIDSPISQVDEKVWATAIKRGGKEISALQELADCKTLLLTQQATLAGLLKAIEQLSAAQGTPVDLAAVTAAAEAGAANALAELDATVTFRKATL
jgi:hypothetical protein